MVKFKTKTVSEMTQIHLKIKSTNMMDISKEKVKMDCPECRRSISVSIRHIANEALIKCICGQKIQLRDCKGSNKKAVRGINRSFKDFERTIKKFGRRLKFMSNVQIHAGR